MTTLKTVIIILILIIHFGRMSWYDETSLAKTQRELYAVAKATAAFVAELYSITSDGKSWNLRFDRIFNGWEIEEVGRLFAKLK